MKMKDMGAMLGLAALWGASFLFIRIASPAVGPLFTIQGRVTMAGMALLLFIWLTKRSTHVRKWWKQYLIIGTLNAAIPFTFIATAELHLNAAMGSILNSLTPLCTALVAWGWMKEGFTVRKWIGMGTGMVGVIILVGWSPIPFTKDVFLAICLSILSTVSYGFAGVYAKKTFTGVSPLSLAAGQQIGAAVVLLPFTLVFAPASHVNVSSIVIVSILGLALLCTSVAYLLYFSLIESVGPTKTLSVTFLVPVFGIMWGVLFLHETLSLSMIAGLLFILGSVFLISDISVKPAVQKRQSL